MPYFRELNEKETRSKETERGDFGPVYQRGNQVDAGVSPSDEGKYLSAGSGDDRLFPFVTEERLQEAQEFRRKGYNSQVPEVDPGLMTQLREALAATQSRLCIQASVGGPLGSLWPLEQVDKITRLTGCLSDDVMKSWIEQALPGKSGGEAAETELGSRRAAQSLARRLESTLQTLIRVVHTLRAIDDYSTPEKQHDMLVDELTGAFSCGDKSTVIQALNRMTAETSGHAAWTSLMQTRAAAWEAGKPANVDAMIETSRYEAEKANKKARELQGASQAFFSHVATYLQSLSSDLAKASVNASQNAFAPARLLVNNDEAAATLLRSNSLSQRIRTDFDKYKLKTQTAVAGMKGHAYRFTRIIRHGHPTGTPTKAPENIVADSIIRSILWQWQQPAIKIQHVSAALLSKVKELKKIEGILASHAVAEGQGSEQESRDTAVGHPGEDDMDAQVREWVSDSIEQENSENQLVAKVATLEQILRGDVASARNLVKRLGKTEESIQNMLRRQRSAVLKMIVKRFTAIDPPLKVDKLLPVMTRNLTASIVALDKALQAAESPTRDFAEAQIQASYAHLLATKVKESLSAESARLTERPLDEHSRGSRLAKHWANLAKEQNMGDYPPPDAEQVLFSLKEQGLLAGTLSTGDPAGYLFATRLAGELENARNDELRLPMSPDQYTALEKGLVEYIVKWGQRRISRGVSRIVIELSFEQALDTVSFNVSSLLRLPYKVLKASIKIPYKVNKVNNYTMPGHDKPYKAIYGLLGKKLKQLGFNLLTAPVPGMIKFAGGASVTAATTLHNLHIDNREKTFSAVYQHVAEGKQSEKIKMNSVKEMVFDSVTDTATTAAFKGTGSAWKSWRSKNNVFSDKDFVSGQLSESDEETHSQAQQGGMAGDSDNPVWGDQQSRSEVSRPTVTEGENLSREAESLTGDRKPDSAVHPDENNGEGESDGDRRSHRGKRAVAEDKTNITRSDFDRLVDNSPYSELPDNVKKNTYFYGIKYLLGQIENDESLPQNARNNAYLARRGAPILVPVDILGYKINNAFLIPDEPGSKSGVLVRLNAAIPYSYVTKGSDLPDAIKYDLPYDANKQMFYYMGIKDEKFTNASQALAKLRNGEWGIEYYLNYNKPGAVDISTLSNELSKNIEEDFKHRTCKVENKNLIQRAIAGSLIPEPDESVVPVRYKLEFTWDNLTPAEYLRSFSRPFTTLAGQVQLIVSDAGGQSIQQTEQSVERAQYTGAWLDASVGAVASLSGAGIVFGMVQNGADIAADVAEGKDPDPLMIAALVIGCLPEGKIATRIGRFSKIGGKSVKYLMMIGNKSIDLAIVGESIKTAVDTGEPLAIYQALLASGMSVNSSYDIAKNMSSQLKIGKKMEDSASLEALEAVYNNTPEYSLSSTMIERTFKLGQTYMLGKINNGEIEISSNNGATWQKGSKIHLLAYRLQNAGGKRRLPDQPRAGSSSSSESSPGKSLLVEKKNRDLPGQNLQNTRKITPEGQVKRFCVFGKIFKGRIRNRILEISSDGGDTWKNGNAFHKICWREAPAGELSVKYLDKKIDKASVKEGPGAYSNICYGTAIRNAGQAEVITPKQTDWLLNKIAKKDSKGEVMGSDHYRQAFGLQNKKPSSSFSSAGITEPGFLHVGERRKDGTVVYDHVAYVHVTDQGTYMYQANGADFLLALNGHEPMQKYNNIGSHVSKSHYKHLMDEKIITRFNDYFAKAEQDGSQAVFTFTPASEVQENYARTSLKRDGDSAVTQ